MGIGLPGPVFDQLVEQDMIDANLRYVETQKRHWVVKDETYGGKIAFEHPMKAQLHNWGLLWQQFRKRVKVKVTRKPRKDSLVGKMMESFQG